jgi:hypothetical protein
MDAAQQHRPVIHPALVTVVSAYLYGFIDNLLDIRR